MRSRLLAKEHASHWGDLREVAVIECLTTGHDVKLDRILWLAVVLLDLKSDDDSEPAVFEALLDPRIPVPLEATFRHGVTAEQGVGRRHFGQIAQEVRELIGDRPVVGFNARYAAGLLDAEMGRYGEKTFYRANAHDIQAALCDAWGYRPTLSNTVTRLGIRREEGSGPVSTAIVTARLASILASASPDTLANLPGDRWVDEDGDHGAAPATRSQLATIRHLGGDPGQVKSTRQGYEMIDALRQGTREGTPATGEKATVSTGASIPGIEWVWLATVVLAALAAWFFL